MKHLIWSGFAFGMSALFAQSPLPHPLDPLSVRGGTLEAHPALSLSPSLRNSHQELGESLQQLPGLHLRRLGAHAGEPLIRGLGWERVQTLSNGMPLHGACPSRMDPPAAQFTAGEVGAVRIENGIPSVIHGPLSIGGRVLIESSLVPAATGSPREEKSLQGFFHTQGKARGTSAHAESTKEIRAWRVDAQQSQTGDYFSADGLRVPANREIQSAGFQGVEAVRPDVNLRLGSRWYYERDTEYPALPMDSRHSKNLQFVGGLNGLVETGRLREWDFQFGLSQVDHLMDNRDKATRPKMRASTPSTADSAGGRLLSRWDAAGGDLRAGIDADRLERDALRTREMPQSGMRFQDPIWPDLQQQRGGGFAEWEGEIGGAFFLRAGMRLDRLESEARKADAMIVPGPGYGKTTVRKAYQDVGRSTTADVRQEDHPVSANLRLSRAISENWKLHGSLGRTEAAPNLTQRYAAFGPVPGGYSVGTPSLRPEVSYEAEIRTEGRAGRHPLGAAVFARRIDDYLLPVTLTRMDVDGDGAPDRVRGTRNEDAEMWGMEVSGIWVLHEQVQVSASLDWVRGRSRSENRDLPEIPPLEFKGGLHWRSAQVTAPAVELGWRVVSKQDKIDPEFGEDATPSFALLHLRAGYAPRPGWRVEVGLENLLNREYHEHLSREALLPTGDLQAGDEVPGPGRSLQVSLRKDW